MAMPAVTHLPSSLRPHGVLNTSKEYRIERQEVRPSATVFRSTQTPALIRPDKGTRNQKIGSWDPSRRSFLVKSIAVSVALLRQ